MLNLPDGFKAKYQALLGEEFPTFWATFDQPAISGFRRNPLRPQVPLAVSGEPVPWSRFGTIGKVDGNGIDHVSGYVYSQEPSAQFVGEVAHPQPGETVLDLCAAPGGKTTHLASFMQGSGVLVANEIDRGRAKILASNVERFGLTNTIVVNHDPASLAKALPNTFDRILVDAPCSGEGMFRKEPAGIQYWTEDYPATCAKRQRDILTDALTMLKPGGTLVYSTCTFAPEEDEQIVAWLMSTHGMTVEPIEKTGGIADGRPEWANGDPALANTARLWPQRLTGEGHFVAKLTKPEGETGKAAPAASVKPLSREQQKLWQEFAASSFNQAPANGQLLAVGDQLFLIPAATPSLTKLRVVRAGLHLGSFKKNRFEPSHSLATAIAPADFQTVVEVDADAYAHYRHGETLSCDQPGKRTVLLTHQGKGFAVGKLVNGTIKNAYPKGLRR